MLKHIERVIFANNPFGYSYALGRTILSLSTLLTLLFNETTTLFKIAGGFNESVQCGGVTSLSIFCIFKYDLTTARFLGIFILALVFVGYRPRLTGLLHFYVTASFNASAITLDGGDQVAVVLSFLLLPISFIDNRISHWHIIEPTKSTNFSKIVGATFMFLIKIQVSVIYFNTAIGKFFVSE
jgi:antimicrobial peptide system SdpB family protein